MIEYTVKVDNLGTKVWFRGGLPHREDGPAIEGAYGDNHWCLNGKHHREDGPAIEYGDGRKEWYLYGEELTETEFNARTKSK